MSDLVEPAPGGPQAASGELSPTATTPVVTLHGDGGMPWRPVSPALATIRRLTALIVLGPLLLLTLALGVLVERWVLIVAAVLALFLGWLWWLIGRQVSAISWLELDDELVLRKGRLSRTLVSIPYGRLQYVDVQSGPLARWKGLASCQIHTASPESSGDLPGLPVAEAEGLRERLTARGEAQRAGL